MVVPSGDASRKLMMGVPVIAKPVGGDPPVYTVPPKTLFALLGAGTEPHPNVATAALAGAAVSPTKRLDNVATVTTTPSIFIVNLLFIDFLKTPSKIL
jgi:hypothetical protein